MINYDDDTKENINKNKIGQNINNWRLEIWQNKRIT